MSPLDGSRQKLENCVYTFAEVMQRQEAQLPQRNSASAAHMEGGWG